MKRNNNIIIGLFIFIVALAAFLRLYKLGAVPASPDWDEAALGYNAYSILKTGRDEYGTPFPLSIRSFDDYKPPLYVYLTVPSVALFGLSTWSVRLPSAIFGILAVIGTYFLVKELFGYGLRVTGYGKEPTRHSSLVTFDYLPLLSSLLLAISPWHLQFSRVAFEANIGVALNIWAVYFFLRGLRSAASFGVSAFLFALSLYAYHSERLFAPLLIVILVITFRKTIFVEKKRIITAVIVGILTVIPLLASLLNPTALTRLQGTSVLADQTGLLMRSVAKQEDDVRRDDQLGKLFDNRRIVWISTLADGYLSHFSMRWLFLDGDNPRHHAPDMGLLYIVELPFFLWGVYRIFKKGGEVRTILFSWLCIAPIAASVTTELPHSIRTLVFLPSFQIFIAVGIVSVLSKIKNEKSKMLFPISCLLLSAFFIFNIGYYLHMYYAHMDKEYSSYWQYGYEEAVKYAEEHKSEYQKIVVSTKLEQPHMFFLFFSKFDPKKYLALGGTKSGGFRERNQFDIYEFRSINWSEEKRDGTILYIGSPSEMPHGNVRNIRFLDGTPAIEIADRPGGAP